MPLSSNYPNRMDFRISKTRPLTWKEMDDMFRKPNNWQNGHLYEQGMVVLWDDSIPPVNNGPTGALSYWLSTSDHISGTGFEPGSIGASTIWFRIGGAPSGSTSASVGPTGPTGPTGPINININSQSSSYSIVLGDEGKLIRITSSSNQSLIIPLNSSQAFSIGTQALIVRGGTGELGITGSSGVSVNSALGYLRLNSQYSAANIIKVGTNEWYVFGDLKL
jgi:hypothetical protein